jgi:hypothetical protein
MWQVTSINMSDRHRTTICIYRWSWLAHMQYWHWVLTNPPGYRVIIEKIDDRKAQHCTENDPLMKK